MYQERYWKELYQLKVHVNYLMIYLEKSERIDKTINIFVAITSSGSICGWAIWQKYSFVWAIIIATSQLITAVKMFLPYKTRIKFISGLANELGEILHYCELRWFDVAEGNLTEEEIHKLQFEIKKRILQAEKKHLGLNTLPIKYDYFNKAQTLTDTYFDNFYPQ